MSGDTVERHGGVLAARPRPAWRTILDVIGVLDLIVGAVLAAAAVTHDGSVPRCEALTPPGSSRQVLAVAFSPDGGALAFADGSDHAYLCRVSN